MEWAGKRRPINVEFTGTPEAGKTTQLIRVSEILRTESYKVETIRESAEIVPKCFKKGSVEANRWMRIKTVEELIRANATDADIILVDRGAVDGFIWNVLYRSTGDITCIEKEMYRLWTSEVDIQPDLLVVFSITPELSIERRGGEGRIINNAFVEKYNKCVESFLKSYVGRYLIIDANRTIDEVTQMLLDSIYSIKPC